MYVALAPALNVSSFGETPEEAQRSVREALKGFIEECVRMGTLADVVEESGLARVRETYTPRKPIVETVMALAA